MREAALRILRPSRPAQPIDILLRVDRWVTRRLVLIGEADELVQSPERQLAEIAEHGSVFGDCDDAAVLIGALLGTVGIPERLVAVGRGGEFVHVFIEAWDGDRWWRLDPVVAPGASLEGLERMVVDL